jgi:hypothetical protein
MANLQLLTDQALGEGTSESLDGLGFGTYAKVLADAAVGNPGPFTIGIFGEWGSGKTSLMRMVESTLSNEEHVVTVWFNAWRFEKEEHPIVPLVATIVRELEQHKSFVDHLADHGKSLIKALRAVAYGFSAKSKVKVPGFAEIEASFVAKEMIDREKALTPAPLLDRSLYYEAFESLSAVAFPKDSRVVVIIDDLDRCFPDQAIRLIESIKLVLSQPGFIFVLGVARHVIEGYLQHRYAKEYGIEDFEGHSYLDKIVQLPFHIPPHFGRLDEFSGVILKRISPTVRGELADILPVVGAASGGNPRATIRFVNNLLIDLAINDALANAGEMERIAIEYFAISRCLQQRWPDTFNRLMSSDELCSDVTKWDRDQLREHASSDHPDYAPIASAVISDRELHDLLFAKHGQAWLANAETRNSTIQFLKSQRQEAETREEAESRRFDLFFSYATEDRKQVSQIAEILADEGLKVLMDTSHSPEEDWNAAVRTGMSEAGGVVFCLGTSTAYSTGVQREIGFAMQRREADERFLILLILLPGVDFDALTGPLRRYQAVKLEKIEKAPLQRVAEQLKRQLD